MYEVQFQPFVGNDYQRQSPKILILGESHYVGEGGVPDQNITREVIRKHAKREGGGAKPLKFFTIIAKTVDPLLTNQTSNQLWDKVAFYNYVQEVAGETARKRPTSDMFINSRRALGEVVATLRPDIIVVLGRQLGSYVAQHTNDFANVESTPILCYWSHPSSPKYFKKPEATLYLDIAKRQFADSKIR